MQNVVQRSEQFFTADSLQSAKISHKVHLCYFACMKSRFGPLHFEVFCMSLTQSHPPEGEKSATKSLSSVNQALDRA